MVTVGQASSELDDKNEGSFAARKGKVEQDAVN
jgi:hypothetical protein